LDQNRTDLVVMGTHGHSGLKSWMLGSVTESVLHRSKVPVFVIRQKMDDFIDTTRPEAKPNIRHILCPCNSNAAAGQALQVASAIAGRLNAHLTVIRALDSATEADEEELTFWIRKTADVSVDFKTVVRTGTAAPEAIRLAKEQNCDLIVLGAHHKPFGQDMVMGRTTELVVRHAPVPVLAVPYQ
jgi:nucleotide-binding universal stress UspA family protein